LRIDRGLSVHQFDSLLDSDQTKPSASPCHSEIEANARVADAKMYLIRFAPQLHAKPLHPAVQHPVVQRFL
jgi:hypothetical protein